MVLGYGSGPALVWSARANKRFGNQTHQLDFSVPLPIRAVDFRTYVIVQYFHGYGESLLSYDQKSNAVRAGIALIR
jgi:phospholipase A1